MSTDFSLWEAEMERCDWMPVVIVRSVSERGLANAERHLERDAMAHLRRCKREHRFAPREQP